MNEEKKEFASQHGGDLQFCKIHVTKGWLRKAKGLLQILWERGLILVSAHCPNKTRLQAPLQFPHSMLLTD
jgi:hypothetical protein